MLSQFSSRIASRRIVQYVTYNDNFVNITRALYNNSEVSDAIAIQLETRRAIRQKAIVDEETRIKPEDSYTDRSFAFMPFNAPGRYDFSQTTLKNWWKNKKSRYMSHRQAFVFERHEILGVDLAAAHFVLSQQGKVKFRDHTDWMEQKDYSHLPTKYDSKYILESVDLSGIPIVYEGLENLCGLLHLRWLSLRNSEFLDDWGIDRISSELPKLEYLDVSECEKVTERGLEALYRTSNLKKLIVTNHYDSKALELTCFLLEDIIPDLECEILLPNKCKNRKEE